MKTSTFKKKVKELGYTTASNVGVRVWPIDRTEGMLAYVSGWQRFSAYIYENVTPELFDLIVEYARTPLEERKDEKKYRLRLTLAYGNVYLKKDTCSNDELYVGLESNSRDRMSAVFTASEIAEIEDKYNLGSFKREEVIEDE